MNIFPEIPNERLSYFKVNVKEWLDADEKIKGLEKQVRELKSLRNKKLEPKRTV